MRNLLQETIKDMAEHGRSPDDVRWVSVPLSQYGVETHWTTWDEFALAADFEYDEGFGGEEIPLSLRVVGDDWWMERHEYDGSEWWEFKQKPTQPDAQADSVTLKRIDLPYRDPQPPRAAGEEG